MILLNRQRALRHQPHPYSRQQEKGSVRAARLLEPESLVCFQLALESLVSQSVSQ